MKCKNCGFQVEESDQYCMSCGLSLKNQCEHCGTELPVTAKFCKACGALQSEEPTVDIPQPQVVIDIPQPPVVVDLELVDYRGTAFLLPGTELRWGTSWEDSKSIGITKEINIISLGKSYDGFPVAYSTSYWNAELHWQHHRRFTFQGREPFAYGWQLSSSGDYTPANWHLYLVDPRIIPAPDLKDSATVIIPEREIRNPIPLDSVSQVLIEQGWKPYNSGNGPYNYARKVIGWIVAPHMTVRTPHDQSDNNSPEFYKRKSMDWLPLIISLSIFGCLAFFYGISYIMVPPLHYLWVKRRAMILRPSIARLQPEYFTVHLAGTNMKFDERIKARTELQRHYIHHFRTSILIPRGK